MTRARDRRGSARAVSTPLSTPRTEGERLLRLAPGTLEELGARLRVSRSAVLLWRSGRRLPGEEHRIRLATDLRIPIETWGRAPGRRAPPRPSTTTATAAPPTSSPLSTLDGLRAHLADIDRDLAAAVMLTSTRIGLRSQKTQILIALGRLEDREAMRGDAIAAHPTFVRIVRVALEVLAPFPDARSAFEAAIARAAEVTS